MIGFNCAVFLDSLPEVKVWVRNLERRPSHSFWRQTSTDCFYPDFVCELHDGRYLVVEYKGEDRWSNEDSREKRTIGEVSAMRSGGNVFLLCRKGGWRGFGRRCRFGLYECEVCGKRVMGSEKEKHVRSNHRSKALERKKCR